MKLIVGLGNPGKEYEKTRHNVGFMILDSFLSSVDWQKKFDGLYQIQIIHGEKVLFLKPMTYMNLSGNSVVKAMKYYDIEIQDVLVLQDDMDLAIGHYKLKKDSSAGGHNGIQSIITSLGTNAFSRLKVGISRDRNGNTVDYVLGKFSKEELLGLKSNFVMFEKVIDCFISNGIEKTMNQYN